MKKAIYILCFLVSLCVSSAWGKQFYFKKYQVGSGLSHNTVWCTLQDSYGFIWFGTNDGLSRFDGKNFRIYRNDIQDASSIGNNFVQTLFEDLDSQNIWVGTNNGVYIYDRLNNSFSLFDLKTEYNVSISTEVKKIIKTQKGNIWIATLGQGLFIYNPDTKALWQNSQHSSFVWDLGEDQLHRIYASSLQEGLICYDQDGKFIERWQVALQGNIADNLKVNCIRAIEDKVWFSVGMNMLYVLDSKTKKVDEYSSALYNLGVIRSIVQFSDNSLLLGSDNGLYLFNIFDGEFIRVDNPLDPRSLSDQSIYAIMKDAEGGFWIATYMGGVNYLAQQTKIFDYFPPSHDPVFSTGKVINRFCENHDNNIWIGAQDGLSLLNIQTQRVEPYQISGTYPKIDVRALLLDGDYLWIGTYSDGLKVLNLKTNQLRKYYHVRNLTHTICSNDVLSLCKDRKGNIYIGTSWGICRYNHATDDFETLNFMGTMTSVLDILEDKYGYLWIATDNSGVFHLNPNNNQWKHYSRENDNPHSITSNSIIKIYESSEGRIWFGTNGNGLCYFDNNSEMFVDFDPQNQILPNRVIYSIEEDNLNNFWISTNAGILRINPHNKSNKKVFGQENGLQSNQFNFRASLRSTTDKLYFGGINGFNAFYPNDFVENKYIPPVYISNVRLYNTTEEENRKRLNLSGPVHMVPKIVLPYNSNSLSFEFCTLSYEDPDKNKYEYILDGFDLAWIYNDNNNTASYTNLPSGKYTFRVRGANNDNQWNEHGAHIQLIILPPWWRTIYAYIGYFVVSILLFYMLVFYLVNRSRKKLRFQMKEYQTKTEKEVYQSKINFFINLVHEIRTPLSLIKLPLEKLSQRIDKEADVRYLNVIDKNVNYLLEVANELLDFQKIESRSVRLHLRKQNMNDLLKEVYDLFIHSAELNNIQLQLYLPDSEIICPTDKEKINKILINLLSNAIKYATTRIDVLLTPSDDSFEITISDDGPGIADDEKEKVFEAFYQSERSAGQGTGIGLTFSRLLAEVHKGSLYVRDNEWQGTVFVLSIPTNLEEASREAEIVPSSAAILDLKNRMKNEESRSSKCSVLLVEDNIELLNMIEGAITSYFTVLKADNGVKALEILSSENIDVVVTDVMMPVMDGLDLCKTIKSDINYCHIPVVMLTAKVSMEAKIEGLGYGADVYLEKPFSIEQLHQQIENLYKLKMAFQRKLASDLPASSSIETEPHISRKDKEFLDKLHEKIDMHISELNFSIDNIAETMFMSRSSFYRKIKNITGMAPNDYLRVARLKRAAELLLQEELSISEICERVAFSSTSYFAKCFKSQFGVLPKEYLEKKKSLEEGEKNNN